MAWGRVDELEEMERTGGEGTGDVSSDMRLRTTYTKYEDLHLHVLHFITKKNNTPLVHSYLSPVHAPPAILESWIDSDLLTPESISQLILHP